MCIENLFYVSGVNRHRFSVKTDCSNIVTSTLMYPFIFRKSLRDISHVWVINRQTGWVAYHLGMLRSLLMWSGCDLLQLKSKHIHTLNEVLVRPETSTGACVRYSARSIGFLYFIHSINVVTGMTFLPDCTVYESVPICHHLS